MVAKKPGRRNQLMPPQSVQVLLYRNEWADQAGQARPCPRNDFQWFDRSQTSQEPVGMLCHKPKRFKGGRREIAQVPGDDDACAGSNRCGYHMPVIGIGRTDAGYQRPVAVDHGIGDGTGHQGLGDGDLGSRDIRSVGEQVAGPLVLDLSWPACLIQSSDRQLNQQVTQRRRVKHVSVEDRDRPAHSS